MYLSSSSPGASDVAPELNTLPSYLRVLAEFRVILCTTHSSCYTRQSLSRHLLEKHYLKSRQRQSIESYSNLEPVATSSANVGQPRDGTHEIRGLPTVLGFLCHLRDCDFRSTSRGWMQQHYNKAHQWQVPRQGAIPWHEVYMQTLFLQKQSRRYFVVILADQIHPTLIHNAIKKTGPS
jgi:hypothetical protein